MDATNPAASAPMMDERRFSNHLCALDSLRLSSLDLLSWCTPFARIQPSIRTFAAAMAAVCCHFSPRTLPHMILLLMLWPCHLRHYRHHDCIHRLAPLDLQPTTSDHTHPSSLDDTDKKANSAGGSPPSKEEGSSGAPTLVLTLPSPCRYYY